MPIISISSINLLLTLFHPSSCKHWLETEFANNDFDGSTCLCSPDTIETIRAVTKPQSLSACDIDRRCKKRETGRVKLIKEIYLDVKWAQFYWYGAAVWARDSRHSRPAGWSQADKNVATFTRLVYIQLQFILCQYVTKILQTRGCQRLGRFTRKTGVEWGSCGNLMRLQSDRQHLFCIIIFLAYYTKTW